MRYLLSVVAGLFVTLGLFYFMSTLISHGAKQAAVKDVGEIVDFIRVKQDESTRTRERKIPKKPEPPKKQPPKPQMQFAEQQNQQQNDLKMDMPKLAAGLKGGIGPYLGRGGGGGSADSEEMPIVRIRPQYPQKAAMRGIEGHVTVSFTITETGGVKDVRILESKPPRVFDRSAQRAVLKWRYRPKVVDGQAIAREMTTTVEFKLSDD